MAAGGANDPLSLHAEVEHVVEEASALGDPRGARLAPSLIDLAALTLELVVEPALHT